MCRFRNVTLKTVKITSKMKRRPPPSAPAVTRSCAWAGDAAVYGAVAAAAVLSYLGSLHGDFVHDDIPAIVSNADVTGARPLRELFKNDFWGTPMGDADSHKSYRPLTTLSFRLNHALAGLRPWWWHACNVLLHAACCALVARACVTVARLRRPFAALAALLFAVHPVHTEAVAGVVGRADVLACIFFLASLLVYHRPSGGKHGPWLSALLGVLGMLAKETGVTVLLVNLALDVARCWPQLKRSAASLKADRRTARLAARAALVLATLALALCLRLLLLQGALPAFSPQDNPPAFHPSFAVRLMTFCYLAAFNWWLLLCPWTLSHDWQMGSVTLVTSWCDPRNLVTCAAFGALLVLCYRCVADIDNQRPTPLLLGVLLLVLPYLPASNLFVTVGFVVAERVLYIPSVGSVIITAYGVQLMWCSRPGTKLFLVVGLVILAASGIARTHRRNADWRDRAALLRADLVTLPHNAKLHYNFGNYLRESEQPDRAIKHYKEALRLWPSYASAHNNLGTLLPERAEHHFLLAVRFNRRHVNAHYNLGKLYKRSGKSQEAVRMFEKCLSLRPRFPAALVELASLATERNRRQLLARLLDLEPDNWEHRLLYGNWMRDKGLPGPASRHYLQALRLSLGRRGPTGAVLRADLITLRSAALTYRSLGQRARTLQLLTRWHAWRRGRPAPAAHGYLREWALRRELRARELLYSRATPSPNKSTKCFNHAQLAGVGPPPPAAPLPSAASPDAPLMPAAQRDAPLMPAAQRDAPPAHSTLHPQHNVDGRAPVTSVSKSAVNKVKCPKSGVKKRTVSLTHVKTTHNKSEIGLKGKCALRRDRKNSEVRSSDVIPAISPLTENIILKTF